MLIAGGAVLALSIAAACNDYSSDDPPPAPDAAVADGALANLDAPASDAGGNARCVDGTTLAHSDGTQETCAFECSAKDTPHCTLVRPTGPMPPALLQATGAKSITFAASARLDTNTGAIAGRRQANVDPLKLELRDDIGFQIVPIDETHKLAIWVFDSVTVDAGVVLSFTTTNAAAFAVAKVATVAGTIDLRGYSSAGQLCVPEPGSSSVKMLGGPGGGAGTSERVNGGGPGGAPGPTFPQPFYAPGIGGGGYAATGGAGGARDGGDGTGGPGSPGGAPYGELLLDPLLGGSGGAGALSRPGGSGGGAFQLVAGEKIVLGDGVTTGGINAGGCGGFEASTGIPGGGGGSGGAVLLETLTIEIRKGAGIAANGGSGGAGAAGKPGALEGSQTGPGAAPDPFYGNGGNGGGANAVAGSKGGDMPAGGYSGGSGGGSAGRIRINTRTGSVVVPPGAVLSPTLGVGATTLGTLRVD